MAKKVVAAEIEVKTANSIADLKALKKQLKDTAAGSEDFNKLSKQIRELDDAIKDASATSDDFAGYLENASGPLGSFGRGLRSLEKNFSSFNGALKASVIGLIVAAIGGLAAAFSQTDGSLKKLQPLLIGMEKIFGGIVKIAEPMIDLILDLGLKALPYVTDAIGAAYSVLSSFLGGLGKLGAAIGKLIKGDFVGAWDEAKKSVTEFGKRYEDANSRFVAGTKEVTKIEKEELDKREAARKAAYEKEKARLDKIEADKKQAILDEKIRRANLRDFTLKSDQEDADYIKELEKLDEEKQASLKLAKQKGDQEEFDRKLNIINQTKQDAKDLHKAEIDAAKELQDAKFGVAEAGLNVLASLAAGNEKLANTIFVIDKALAIAKIIVSTQAEIGAISLANAPLGIAGAPLTASQILAAKLRAGIGIATIAATSIAKFKGGGGANVPANGGSGSISAPLLPQASRTTLNQDQVNQIGNVAARAFVVESDVTGNQERIQRLNRAARIN